MIVIKPHHLIDIMKLYGAGVEHFVPDESYQHDFYKVANCIIENLDTELQFTILGDDICKPCNRFKDSRCSDPLDHIRGYHCKDTYNQALDSRLIDQLKLDQNAIYTPREFIEMLSRDRDIIFHVWLEEDSGLTEKRNRLFQEGLKKLRNVNRKMQERD
ncbi:DUF1284 domain-containing protein [Enterocloster lavalensis]|uniref:DUF1284 domain-containing protein n=1 Tax=Enterocloster lavalensis TaxID=460384 RepID=UPI001D0979D0|nr:DUF1284 domain-containing protein [Enterocloster lavalensis]MCB6344273.1 DUF1284 domain-containing protein [Enterocloster lavalensis]